ncbi:MAG: hypothetical protein V3W41_01270 [Planctomycetota bacterium]
MEATPSPGNMSSVNRGITAMILSFVALSLTASVLPLWPGIQELLPFGFLTRDRAMGGYALALLGFMALLFPLFVRCPEKSRSIAPWWWVGGYAIVFASVPLFLLAWIAGVHRNGVLAILLWAGVFHGAVLLLLRALRYRMRLLIVAVGGLFAFAFPLIDFFEGLLGGQSPKFEWTPFSRVLSIVYDYAPVSLLVPGLTFAAVQVTLWLTRERRGKDEPRRPKNQGPNSAGSKVAASIFVLVIAAGSLAMAFYKGPAAGATKPSVADSLRVILPSGNAFVPGASYPIGLVAKAGVGELKVKVASREFWSFEGTNSAAPVWIYPRLLEAGESIEIFDKSGRLLRTLSPKPTPGLILAVDDVANSMPENSNEMVRLPHLDLPDSHIGYDPITAVWILDSAWRALPPRQSSALADWVGLGGDVTRLGASENSERRWGDGRYHLLKSLTPILSSPPRVLAHEALHQNLYSNFALPNWGRVDLNPVLIFLAIYHLVFALIFLLPLYLDGKKSLAVYLISVGFVLALVVVGAQYALKKVFFTDTQILQQSLEVLVVRGEGRDTLLQRDELACFASFNGAPGDLSFDRAFAPRPLFENRAQGSGSVRVDGDRLKFENVRLDRFRRKQIFLLRSLEEAPFTWTQKADEFVLEPKLGQKDSARFWAAKPLVAFARLNGRLHRASYQGGRLKVDKMPDPASWQGVLPQKIRKDNGIPFLRHVLGRYAPPQKPVAVVLFSGLRGLHQGEGYLLRRDILQLLILPFDAP